MIYTGAYLRSSSSLLSLNTKPTFLRTAHSTTSLATIDQSIKMSDLTNKATTHTTSEVPRDTDESNAMELIKTRETQDLNSPHTANTGQAGPWSAATPSSGEGMDEYRSLVIPLGESIGRR